MTSFCLHDDGQHDFSATFNAFRPTNPATGRSLSILAKPGLGSCDPWIVKSCQKVMSWDFWGACAKHPEDTVTSHQRWHIARGSLILCLQSETNLFLTFLTPSWTVIEFIRPFNILSKILWKEMLLHFGTFFVVEFLPLISIEFFLQQQEIVYRWNHVNSVAFLFVSVKPTGFAQH